MRHLVHELKNEDSGYQIKETFYIESHIPLQIFRFKKGLSVDIQIPRDNYQAIRNTNLIKHYLLADPRFPKIYTFFKRLFEALGIRNSKGGLLSSYHLIMLTIHFLQSRTVSPPSPHTHLLLLDSHSTSVHQSVFDLAPVCTNQCSVISTIGCVIG